MRTERVLYPVALNCFDKEDFQFPKHSVFSMLKPRFSSSSKRKINGREQKMSPVPHAQILENNPNTNGVHVESNPKPRTLSFFGKHEKALCCLFDKNLHCNNNDEDVPNSRV